MENKEIQHDTEAGNLPHPLYPPVYGPPIPAAKPWTGLAIASLVIGIFSLLFFWVPFFSSVGALLSVVFGVVSRRKGGNGLAIAGLVLGIISFVLGSLILVSVINSFSRSATVAENQQVVSAAPAAQSLVPSIAQAESEAVAHPEIQTVQLGDTIVTEHYEITLYSLEMAPTAYSHGATNPFAYHLQADEGNTFVDLTVQVKNLKKNNADSSNIMHVEVDYNQGYTYSASDYVEDHTLGLAGYSSFWGDSIKPLETVEIRYIAQCPEEVEQNLNAPLSLLLRVSGVQYQLIVR